MLKLNIKLLIDPPKKMTMAHLSPSVDRDRRPWVSVGEASILSLHRVSGFVSFRQILRFVVFIGAGAEYFENG